MQVFEKLITDLKKHDIGNFKAWLHTVTKNYCLMLIRRSKPQRFVSFDANENSSEVVEMNVLYHPDNSDEKEINLQLLEAAVQQLNDDQKKCIELFYLQEKSYQEVSQMTGYTMLQVKSFIQNGKRNLKLLMSAKGLIRPGEEKKYAR